MSSADEKKTEKKSTGHKPPDYRLPETGFWANAWKAPALLAVIGAVISALGLTNDPARYGYSYLFGFAVVATFVFGGLFLTIGLHITQGVWGITSRRLTEIMGAGAVLLAILFVPLAGGVASGAFPMYDEWMRAHHGHGHDDHGDEHEDHEARTTLLGASVAHAQDPETLDHDGIPGHEDMAGHVITPQMERQHHHILEHKSPWLNQTGWLVRSGVYLLVFILLGLFYFRSSLAQDEAKDFKPSLKMKRAAPVAALSFGLALTFAAFDWLMSLEPTWYSTIYGVTIFAGSAVAVFATCSVIGIGLYRARHIGEAINVEHFHDLGKFLFAFMCFWAYTCFSQWMLIWYAGIPEEATWFHKRWQNGWSAWALFLMIGHFGLPFYFLISRLVKRNLPMMRIGAIWLLGMHVCDVYFQVIPQSGSFGQGFYLDVGALLLLGGIFFAYVLLALKRVPLVPVGDPRFARCLHHHQTH